MVCIVIPNYNGIEHLKTCLESLRSQTYKEFKIILVDNNSSDESIEFVQEHYPGIEIIQLSYNSGFAKAVNIGIQYSLENYNSDFVTLLNNDTECNENFLVELLNGFKYPEIGSV